ncbi:MAG: hypothetical protein HY700_13355 [Gemmatimonadetes bacterium]|nr:hypothetical protein [Gemmatimonadota bacterium]
MTGPNRVALTLGSIFAGAAAGAAVVAAGVWTGNWLMMNGKMTLGDPRNAVFLGGAVGLLLALFVGWTCSAGLEETWRRAAIAVVATFGAVAAGGASYLLSVYSLMMMSRIAQLLVPGYLVLLAIIAIVAARVARRHGRALLASPTTVSLA